MSVALARQKVTRLIEVSRTRNGGYMDRLAWTLTRRPYIEAGRKFNVKDHHWLVPIYLDPNEQQVFRKASQMFISELAVNHMFWCCDERNLNVCYIFPTSTDVSRFSATRVGPAIDESPYLQSIIGQGELEKDLMGKSMTDNVTLKRIRNRHAHFLGGKVDSEGKASQLKSVSSDVLVLDELDEMDHRTLPIARHRLDGSLVRGEIFLSTPTFEGHGIDDQYSKSRMYRWFVRCPHCGHWQHLTIDHLVLEFDDMKRPVIWNEIDGEPYLACSRCDDVLDRFAAGEWVAQHPNRTVSGYHLNRLFHRLGSLQRILDGLGDSNPTTQQETWNQDLGEPVTPDARSRLTDEVLKQCERSYNIDEINEASNRNVMGIDVGAMLNVVVRGPLDGAGERPLLFADAFKDWNRLPAIVNKFNAKVVVIDAMPETTLAREFQDKFEPGRVWLCFVRDAVAKARGHDWNMSERHVSIDRTMYLDKTLARFRDEENTHGEWANRVPEFIEQLKAPVRVIKTDAKGRPKAKYVHSKPDHFCFSEVFATVASMRFRN